MVFGKKVCNISERGDSVKYLNHYIKPILLTFFITLAFALGACGESLQKPTGLENDGDTQKDVQEGETASEHKGMEIDKKTKTKPDDDSSDSKTAKADDENKSDEEDSNNESQSPDEEESMDDSQEHDHNQSKDEVASADNNEENNASSSKDSNHSEETNSSEENNSNDDNSSPEDNTTNNNDPSEDNNDNESNENNSPNNDGSSGNDNSDKPEEENDEDEKKDNPSVTYSIVIAEEGSSGEEWCEEHSDNDTCPDDGGEEIPLSPTEMEITEEDTVLDTLIDVTKSEEIQMDYRGGKGSSGYVEGIDNVYEFDRGQGSGWMFRVNGVFTDRGAGTIPLCDGDEVEWLYTNDLGEDLGADLESFRADGTCP